MQVAKMHLLLAVCSRVEWGALANVAVGPGIGTGAPLKTGGLMSAHVVVVLAQGSAVAVVALALAGKHTKCTIGSCKMNECVLLLCEM